MPTWSSLRYSPSISSIVALHLRSHQWQWHMSLFFFFFVIFFFFFFFLFFLFLFFTLVIIATLCMITRPSGITQNGSCSSRTRRRRRRRTRPSSCGSCGGCLRCGTCSYAGGVGLHSHLGFPLGLLARVQPSEHRQPMF
jgi:hypothetical protein